MKERSQSPLITDVNPMGTDGFEFIEFSSVQPEELNGLFSSLGLNPVARHRHRDLTLYRQGDITFLVNGEPDSFGHEFSKKHGPCACAFGIRVADADYAFKRALVLEAEAGVSELSMGGRELPCILGIGGSLLYFVDQYDEADPLLYDDFIPTESPAATDSSGLLYLDHVTHNVYRGNMDVWAGFYERLFNFREIRYFDIEGRQTGLKSRAMTSPCGKIRIPINESSDDKSQIEEYLEMYQGEGIQHIALATDDIYQTVDRLLAAGTQFLSPPPATYYEMLPERLPWQTEDIEELKSRSILMDGAPTEDGGLLLQIFTETVIGPIFFEIIQRKGDEGFGEGNFKALFESMERDQIRRGVLKEA